MAYIALYRKWRPLVFKDVVEQEHVVRTLKNSVSTGRIAHAYLFCGSRGTGKTTMAKILSRAINCLNPKEGDPCNACEACRGILSGTIMDVVEIDAASNNSVDNVREIRDEVMYTPSSTKYKVYIIDEVHMLSSGAFNALLKTLEEPPSHVVFILATTEPHKLPATILSRCQRFDFRRISLESIIQRLDVIAGSNGVNLQRDAARLIARMAEGALRDAISILDQCIAMGSKEISYSDVLNVVGVVNDYFIADMVEAIKGRNVAGVLEFVERLVMDGKDIAQFVSDLVFYFRNVLVCKLTDKPGEILELSEEALTRLKELGKNVSKEEIILDIKELSSLEAALKWATHPRILLEVALIKLCEGNVAPDENDLLQRIAILEKKVQEGSFVLNAAPKEILAPKKAEGPAPAWKAPGVKPAETKEVKSAPASGGVLRPLTCWDTILDEVKKSGRMSLYTNLFNTKAAELDDRTIGIVFDSESSFSRANVSKNENIEVVSGLLSKKLGKVVRAKCIGVDEAGKTAKEEKASEDEAFVKRAREIAGKHDIPINIIDE